MPNSHGDPTMADLLTFDQGLEIECLRCRRTLYLRPADAIRKIGLDVTFTDARKRLKCTYCGQHGGPELLIDVRPSIMDYYDMLERQCGMKMPGRIRTSRR